MTPQEKDRYIVEWFGECWHESSPSGKLACIKCGKDIINPDLTSDSGFFWLWERMRDVKRFPLWNNFLMYVSLRIGLPDDAESARVAVIGLIDDRVLFRDTVFDFLQTQKGE